MKQLQYRNGIRDKTLIFRYLAEVTINSFFMSHLLSPTNYSIVIDARTEWECGQCHGDTGRWIASASPGAVLQMESRRMSGERRGRNAVAEDGTVL
jgi:hypothetical protein